MRKLLVLLLMVIFAIGLVACNFGTDSENDSPDNSSNESTGSDDNENIVNYTVTFDADNGADNVTQTVNEGEKITAPDEPKKEGYTFLGWFLGDNVWDFENGTVTSDITLYAKWLSDNDYFTYTFADGKATITGYTGNATELVIPEKIYGSDVVAIADNAFRNKSKLTSITIPDSVTSIGKYAFAYCDSLTSVSIGNSVTSIGEWTFYNCRSLTSVSIPDSVTSIGYCAFVGCTSLTRVYYKGTATEWSKISIDSYNTELRVATRYYYSEEKPTTEGNFWHYDENGNVAVW